MQPITIITGSLLAQVLLGILMFVAANILYAHGNRPGSRYDFVGVGLHGLILFLLLISVAILLSTKSLSAIWINLFRDSTFAGIDDQRATLVVFIVDIFITGLLILFTGGGISSPFQPIFFLIPTLALLLYESTERVLLYSALVTVSFIALSTVREHLHWYEGVGTRRAYGFVSVACLVLVVLIGVLTRSCPTGTC